ncbi:unnamed protein product, partial [Rotaria sordida]
IEYEQTIEFLLDGQSVTVYQLMFISTIDQPILVGISGQALLTNNNVLLIDGVFGEAGTETNNQIFVILPNEQLILYVFVNGKDTHFQSINEFIVLTDRLSFPGLYLPRSAELLNNTIIISDLLLEQLKSRQLPYPIQWTEKE